MHGTAERLRDWLDHWWRAWRLGLFLLVMLALRSVASAIPVALVIVLMTAPFHPADSLVVSLVAIVSVPFGAGAVIPWAREQIAEYEAAEVERRKRAIGRTVAKYRA